MMMRFGIFIFAGVILVLSCAPERKQVERAAAVHEDLEDTGNGQELAIEEEKDQHETEHRSDSVRLDLALKDAFDVARPAFARESFRKDYELHPDDSSYSIYVEIDIGDLFSHGRKYFLLRRHVPWATYIDVFRIAGMNAEKVISREQGGMTYVRDTIFDVNGDGFKDFLVHWYPASGCCRRDIYNVYLNLPYKEQFTGNYEFINPTFFAEEKIVRGVGYGHPGEVGLYKYRWNGLNIDTVEFIYPDVTAKGQFIKTKRPAYRPTAKEGIVLKAVPKEYDGIESYEWFADLY